eukprot:362365-Rhodomonas_salina.2
MQFFGGRFHHVKNDFPRSNFDTFQPSKLGSSRPKIGTPCKRFPDVNNDNDPYGRIARGDSNATPIA